MIMISFINFKFGKTFHSYIVYYLHEIQQFFASIFTKLTIGYGWFLLNICFYKTLVSMFTYLISTSSNKKYHYLYTLQRTCCGNRSKCIIVIVSFKLMNINLPWYSREPVSTLGMCCPLHLQFQVLVLW